MATFSEKEQEALDAAGKAWNEAKARGDQAGMDKAHADAEAIRASKGYTGGADGSKLTKLPSSSGGSSSSKSSGNSQYTTAGKGSDYYAGQEMSAEDQALLKSYGDAYNSATNDAQRQAAHAAAEALRAKYGYSGGGDGSDYIALEKPLAEMPSFTYTDAPTYKDPYSSRIDEMLNQILNRDAFSYDAMKDPLYAQYQEQYAREGQRAMQDTLGQVAARTGGLGSSWATTAAQQQNNYYMQQLSDKIPELYQLAYEMYLDDIDLQVQDLGLLQNASNTAYDRYRDTMSDWRDDRDFAYGVYRDDVADGQWDKVFDRDVFESDRDYEYGVGRDEINDQRYDDEWAYQQEMDKLAQSNWEKEFAHQQAQDALDQNNWEKEFGLEADKFAYEKELDDLIGSGSGGSGKTETVEGPDGIERTYDSEEFTVDTKTGVVKPKEILGKDTDEYEEAASNYQEVKAMCEKLYASDGKEAVLDMLREAYKTGALNLSDYSTLFSKYRNM